MPTYINISNLDNTLSWEKQLSEGPEYEKVKTFVNDKSRSSVGIIKATLTPIRTNNLKNFSKDFFLPTTINHAIKVQKAASKPFAILASLILDVLTFPIRFLTCIPRIISNAKQEEHLLHKYLIKEGADKTLLESGHARVELGLESISQFPTSTWTADDDSIHSKYSIEEKVSTKMVNFIEVPMYESWKNKLVW